ncbi:MAG: Gfo/Idh/MocA family oxidoreductase [Acidobacteria bacterium]|nr:Gfo/Idh/MocA family oxidoreductase [Acidobacteriota bacterium]
MRIGVIGYGYWGPNLVRNFAETAGVEVKWCADNRADRLAIVKKRYPSIQVTEDAGQIFDDPDVNAVVIATPVSTHFKLVKQALERGKHVLVEKPMTRSVAEGQELLELAEKKGLVLMVDHTFIYTGAVRKIKEILDGGELGELHYLDSVRINLGLFQSDIDVLWDLAPHDLAILTYLVSAKPKFVSATGSDHTGRGLVDVAYMTVQYADNFLAHFHTNWLSPVKLRQMLIGGSRRMLVYNDMEPSEKVRVYDRGVKVTTEEGIHKTLVDYRTGDMWAPKLELREALGVECEHFLECVRFNKIPWSSAAAGLNVVRLLEGATKSLAKNGTRVAV